MPSQTTSRRQACHAADALGSTALLGPFAAETRACDFHLADVARLVSPDARVSVDDLLSQTACCRLQRPALLVLDVAPLFKAHMQLEQLPLEQLFELTVASKWFEQTF